MKLSEFKAYLREEIIEILSEESAKDIEAKTKAQAELNAELAKTKKLSDELSEAESEGAAMVNTIADEPISEEEEEKVEIDPDDSVAQIANKLGETSALMRSLNNQYKKAEGEEKEKLFNRLKELSKIKRELEGLL